MAKKVTAWESDDGTLHHNELQALLADRTYWKLKAEEPHTTYINYDEQEHNSHE